MRGKGGVECRSLPSSIAAGSVMLKAGRLKGANGNQGDAVWSNLVSEAWQLRGRGGGGGALNPRHKKREIYHFTSASAGWGRTFNTWRTGAQLREL